MVVNVNAAIGDLICIGDSSMFVASGSANMAIRGHGVSDKMFELTSLIALR